ncbi:MAG: DUF502 domain-containing protein [Kiritimatiellae bacterium]|nr:DUF502 domain-containing protein [Kiritimatiellia bacterium]
MKNANGKREKSTGKKKGLFARIGNNIFIGVILITPLIATVLIFNFLLRITTSWIPPKLLQRVFPQLGELYNGYLIKVIVLIAILAMLFMLGVFAHNFLGKFFLKLFDRILSRIPFIRNIYVFIRQICEWIARSMSQGGNSIFQSVVMVEYPRKGCYAIGFTTSETLPGLAKKLPHHPDGTPREFVNVFIPTTPNPTSGFFLIFPKEETTPMDIDVPSAVNLIISAGAILPEHDAEKDSFLKLIDSIGGNAQ